MILVDLLIALSAILLISAAIGLGVGVIIVIVSLAFRLVDR